MEQNWTPQEVIAWLRKQAKSYSDAADSIEATLAPAGNTQIRRVGGYDAVYPKLTLQALRERIAKKSARIGQLALEFGVSESEIEALVMIEGNGITTADRGWLKLKDAQ